jgi:hypothetical protein
MARNIIFKTLIDILFIFQGFGILGAFLIMPFGVTKINQINLDVSEWSMIYWSLLVLSLIAFIGFILGVFFLRKVGRYLLSNQYFAIEIINNLKSSGRFFIYSGVISFSVLVISWIIKFNYGNVLLYNTDIVLPIFITIVGLFFIIQSDVLLVSKNAKEYNDLTI